jgi:putative ABC transport system ATP-binding protein
VPAKQHEVIIEARGLKRSFRVKGGVVQAVKGIDLEIRATDFCVVYGPSGCGKTTLLNLIAGIDTPTSGEVVVRDVNIGVLPEDERGVFRSKKMGIVYQLSNWVKSLNGFENVALPLIIEGKKRREALKRAQTVMRELGILDLGRQIPTELSGGQQQRLGMARALVTNPWIILADEPTGNLDSTTADSIMAIFDILNKKYKRTIIMITHNQSYWTLGTRRIEMKDGLILRDVKTNKNG